MKEDFSRFCLPPFWYYYFDELGEGVSVDFLVKLKTKLGFHSKRLIVNNFGSLEKGPLIPSEKVSVVIMRKACSKNTITKKISALKAMYMYVSKNLYMYFSKNFFFGFVVNLSNIF